MELIDLETHTRYIRGIAEITRAVSSGRPLEEILNQVVSVTARVMGFEICSIWLIDDSVTPKRIRLRATQALDPEYSAPRSMGRVEGVAGFVATHNQTLRIPDVLKEPRFKNKAMARRLGLVSLLSVPLQAGEDAVIGVLNGFTSEGREFTDVEVHQARAVADLTALAIRSASLAYRHRELEEELETRKAVERAKEILLRRGVPGDQAYRWLQKRSMDSRKSMRQIAEALILSDELTASQNPAQPPQGTK
ncbi:MAG: GAF domain-containing protein [Desulfobacteraceae bacterium]